LREGDLDLGINLLPDEDIVGDLDLVLALGLGLDDDKNVVGPAASVNGVGGVPAGAKVNLGVVGVPAGAKVNLGVAPPLLVFLIFLV
jgi:hypothetical protein